MGDAARPDDQHAVVAQRRERLSERMMPFGRGARGNRKLDDRNIGLGIDQRQWHPGAMIEPAFRIGDDGKSVLREQVDDARSEEHTSELPALMRNSYAVFCLKKKNKRNEHS